ncbi:MAG: flavodoxin family protein [Lachnospiraceae bacterium]|jgi:flavodoxin I|nr:flavodoxin family protein [Lachnospiraceae bacterium]MDD3614713.1 flavodoxin family protein [Lachnospiraceae bacterium]
MKAIVYSSKTGNTEILAKAIQEQLPENSCNYFGTVKEIGDLTLSQADMFLVGFWTDKGNCDPETALLLQNLHNKKIFLFGTAGFGANDAYFDQILNKVQLHIDSSNTIAGTFMCQGKMPMSVRTRYESMQEAQPDKMQNLIANFDKALSHPDENDLRRLKEVIHGCVLLQ